MQYVALYAGPNHKDARLVCAVTDPEIVVSVAKAGLRNLHESPDPVLAYLSAGARNFPSGLREDQECIFQSRSRGNSGAVPGRWQG